MSDVSKILNEGEESEEKSNRKSELNLIIK